MPQRAPRFGQIEIPLTLTLATGESIDCSCLNISSSGALLHFQADFKVELGMMFSSKMVRQGLRVKVWMRVERIAAEGVGVYFIAPEDEAEELGLKA